MWDLIVPVSLGGLLAILGTIVGQHWQAKEARQARSEQFEREDKYRLFRDRVDAYRSFHLAFGNARRAMANCESGDRTTELLDLVREARSEVWREFTLVWLIGSEDVVKAATSILDFVDGVSQRDEAFDDDKWRTLVISFVDKARVNVHDISKPGQPLT